MQAWEHGASPQWPNTRGGVGRGCGPAGDGGEGRGSGLLTLPTSLGHIVCPSTLPFSLLEVPSHRGGSKRAPGMSLGSSGADSPCGSSRKGMATPHPPPTATNPRAGLASLLQSPERSLHLCSPSRHSLQGIGMLCAARVGVRPPHQLPVGPSMVLVPESLPGASALGLAVPAQAGSGAF